MPLANVIALVFAYRDQVLWVAVAAAILLVMSTIPALAWAATRLPAIRRSTERYRLAARASASEVRGSS
jgi:hypothetical protein